MASLVLAALLNFSSTHATVIESVEKQGVVVDFSVESTATSDNKIRPGDGARILFHAHDNTSGAPIRGAYPAAWIQRQTEPKDDAKTPSCTALTQQFIGSSLFSQAEIDLNVYHVLTMNDDASLSIVDPLFGFGGSKLLHMQSLSAPAYDWTKNADQTNIFLTLPTSNVLANLDTHKWLLHENQSPQLLNPKQLILQEDQQYLWVSTLTGVAVVNAKTLHVTKAFDLHAQPTHLVISKDSRFVFALTPAGDTNPSHLWVLDAKNQTLVLQQALSGAASSMAYSALAEVLYIADTAAGRIYTFDSTTHKIITTIDADIGISQIRFDPSGRWGFVLNSQKNTVAIIDAAKSRIVQSSVVEHQPESVAFSDEFAYIRHAGSDTLLMIPLDENSLGEQGARIRAIDTTGGDHAPGLNPQPSAAPGIVQAPGSNAVLISNYHDKAIYFYKEGMAAPMGQFNNYGRSPRAVMTIDKSLRERKQAGVYETTFKVPEPGTYNVVYFMDSPRINHCFTLNIQGQNATALQISNNIQEIMDAQDLTAGKQTHLKFSVQNEYVHKKDIHIAISLQSGQWRETQTLTPDADGLLRVVFTPPARGVYQVDIANQQFSYLIN